LIKNNIVCILHNNFLKMEPDHT